MTQARDLADLISNSQVDADEMGGASVDTASIVDGAVTDAKVASGIVGTKISYDNTVSGISANTMQEAVDYLNALSGGSSGSVASYTRDKFVATAGQTTFTPSNGYQVGYIEVYMNGVLLDITDYSASDTVNVVLSVGASAGDEIVTIALDSFAIAELLRVTQISASSPDDSIVINASGNIGLGTATPTQRLDLEGASGARIAFTDTGTQRWSIGNVGTSLTFQNESLATEAMRLNSSGYLGVGTINPGGPLDVTDDSTYGVQVQSNGQVQIKSNSGSSLLQLYDTGAASEANATPFIGYYYSTTGFSGATTRLGYMGFASGTTNSLIINNETSTGAIQLINNGTTNLMVHSNGNVGIGSSTVEPQSALLVQDETDISMNANGTGHLQIDGLGYNFAIALGADAANIYTNSASRDIVLGVNETEVMRVGNGHTFFGGKTSTGVTSYGAVMEKVDSSVQLAIHRQASDGKYIEFYRGSTNGGGIFSDGGNTAYVGGNGCGLLMRTSDMVPTQSTGVPVDNTEDLGDALYRFDDLFATNGTIQTSDANEKQQIATLTDAEITAAKAISKLFKTFKWNDSVAEKGDAARTHTGVIAQDVEAAMADAGLDAGNYAFFTKNTWWEIDVDVPAVEADEENNIKAQDAYTRTDKYEVFEEAPEGAVERTRRGVRYPELLAFIGAATEQRLASIEARLDALETV